MYFFLRGPTVVKFHFTNFETKRKIFSAKRLIANNQFQTPGEAKGLELIASGNNQTCF